MEFMKTKLCKTCGETKPVTAFRLREEAKDGYAYRCKTCQAAAGREYVKRYAADPEWREKRRAHNAAYHQATWAKRADVRHWSQIRAKYGIEPADYRAILEAQGHACAICKGQPSRTKRLHIDHDHVTNHVRGLLCDSCNLALGKFRDDPELLRAAAAYLELSRA